MQGLVFDIAKLVTATDMTCCEQVQLCMAVTGHLADCFYTHRGKPWTCCMCHTLLQCSSPIASNALGKGLSVPLCVLCLLGAICAAQDEAVNYT